MATTEKLKRTNGQAPAPPVDGESAQSEPLRFEQLAGYDPDRGGWIHQDSGKEALALVKAAAAKRRRP